MSSIVLYTLLTLSSVGALAAIILYFVAQKFKVYEDPRIDEVEAALPAANCGGCGFAGCRNFAEALVKADEFGSLYCPVGGNETMEAAAKILGKEAVAMAPMVAVVRCGGSCDVRPVINKYDGAASCTVASALYSGQTGCQYGCLGLGECVDACSFDAIVMNPETGLPEVIDDKCTACGACVDACPKDIVEIRKKNKNDRKIFVSCVNKDKGAVAKKSCEVACIGCKKCVKACNFDAIVVENFLAYIDHEKCKLCRKCVAECPTGAIQEVNFPERKVKKEEEKVVTETSEKNKEEGAC